MKKYLLAAVAVTALASPAYARDGQPYFGIEGGILFPKDQDADVVVDYTTTQTVATTPTFSGTSTVEYDNAFGLDYKKGLDVDVGVLVLREQDASFDAGINLPVTRIRR